MVAASLYPDGAFQTAPADRGKDLPATPAWKSLMGYRCISQIRIFPGNAARMRMPMASCESFPKGTDCAQMTDEALETTLRLINHRPRKCLGWRTAHESFLEELSCLALQSFISEFAYTYGVLCLVQLYIK